MKAYGLLAAGLMLVGTDLGAMANLDPSTPAPLSEVEAVLASAAGALAGAVFDDCPAEAKTDCVGSVCILDALANPRPGEPMDGQIMDCVGGGLVCYAFTIDGSALNVEFVDQGIGIRVSGLLGKEQNVTLEKFVNKPQPMDFSYMELGVGTLLLRADPDRTGCA